MIEYFKSVNNKYTYDNDKYLKNGTPLMDEDGNIDPNVKIRVAFDFPDV